jgi:hypothetical protein
MYGKEVAHLHLQAGASVAEAARNGSSDKLGRWESLKHPLSHFGV